MPVTVTVRHTSTLQLRDWKNIEEKRGRYIASDAFQHDQWKASTVECPYCHSAMFKWTGKQTICRVIDVGKVFDDGQQQEASLSVIPQTHTILKCKPCRQFFTVPNRRS